MDSTVQDFQLQSRTGHAIGQVAHRSEMADPERPQTEITVYCFVLWLACISMQLGGGDKGSSLVVLGLRQAMNRTAPTSRLQLARRPFRSCLHAHAVNIRAKVRARRSISSRLDREQACHGLARAIHHRCGTMVAPPSTPCTNGQLLSAAAVRESQSLVWVAPSSGELSS